MRLQQRLFRVLFLLLLLPSGLLSSADAQDEVIAEMRRQTVPRLQKYLRVDTTNPPGNESRAVDFFAEIFKAEGIPYETAEKVPGRGNIWARLTGGSEPSPILLNHTDVVPANRQ